MGDARAVVPGRPSTYVPIDIATGVRAAARRTPGKIALQEDERTLTYAQLADRIGRVASALRATVYSPGRSSHVAVMAPNCLEFIEIVLGAASAGVPSAMVNPRNTQAELEYICNDSEARVLFVHRSFEELARAAELPTVERIIVIGGDYDEWLGSAQAGWGDPSSIEEWDTFCIPYTAGTTGNPKGVLLSHRARALTFFAMATEYGCYSEEDRTLGVAPLYHGAGFAFSVAALAFGGYCAILPKFDPERVLTLLEDLHITNTFLVPTHFSSLFALGDDAVTSRDLTRLDTIICNAAPLSQVLKERIVHDFGAGVLYEAYGSTEASIVSNLRPADQLRKQASVGRPFPYTSVRVLDADGNDVELGQVGELYSRSPYLFNGYWRKEKETAAAFRDGWFTAGDLARQDDEGFLYLVDRKDDMIISGGTNIYPREVEETLARHPSVVDVAVYGIPDAHWGEAVHATVVLAPGTDTTDEQLIAFCADKLARYKQPKSVDFEAKLPRNAAGKILRRELRDRRAQNGG